MALSKRKNKKKKSNLPILIMVLSAGALYAYWQQSEVELFPSETIITPEIVTPAQEAKTANLTVAEVDSAPETSTVPAEIVDPQQEMEKAWDQEVLAHLNRLEPIKANDIYAAYIKERQRYLESVESALAKSLNQFGGLNTELLEATSNELTTNEAHDQHLAEIFGVHYDYFQAQKKKFIESYQDIDPKEVEKQGE